MISAAWQSVERGLQILLVGLRPVEEHRIADALGAHGGFAAVGRATTAGAAEELGNAAWDCVLAGAGALGDVLAKAGDVPVIALQAGAPEDDDAPAIALHAGAAEGAAAAEAGPAHSVGDAAPAAPDDRLPEGAEPELVARVIRHVVERRRTAAALARSAMHDPVTGLPNRALLTDRLGNAFSRLPRSGRHLAVLCISLDGFKLVNDSLGHAAGDKLLRLAGERLRSVMRPSDTVARLGDAAFAVLCDEMAPDADAEPIAHRVLTALEAPFPLPTGEHHVAASVGIAHAGAGGGAAQVLREADAAMTAARRQGGGCARYQDAMGVRALRRLTLHNELHGALEREELVLHYQPQVPLGGGPPTGVEALVRWRHPERGLVPPGDFIPVAESSGLIVPIGRWVLRAACAQLARWTAEGGPLGRLTMAVNLSARQLAHPSLVADVRAILVETGVDPARVCLEITETAVLDDVDLAVERLSALKALGVRLAIDDFGTGYSSLSQLGRFPVDVLKIDRSFVQAMGESGSHPRGRGVVAAVITLAGAMDMIPVAEGVEREEQAEVLRALGCPSAQGYLFSAPRDAAEIERLILGGPESPAPLRVVVCDDAPALRALLRTYLERDGRVEVIGEAGDGEHAVALAEALRPDVILLDVRMPKVDGLSALPAIRRAAPDARVVVLSGCDADATAAEALALGAGRYVEKPAGVEAIRAAVLQTAAA